MKVVDAPKYKKDWVGKSLMLNEICPAGFLVPLPGTVVWIKQRLNAKDTMHSAQDVSRWGAVRVLKCSWECPTCKARHQGYMPESWIEEGKAVFVDK